MMMMMREVVRRDLVVAGGCCFAAAVETKEEEEEVAVAQNAASRNLSVLSQALLLFVQAVIEAPLVAVEVPSSARARGPAAQMRTASKEACVRRETKKTCRLCR